MMDGRDRSVAENVSAEIGVTRGRVWAAARWVLMALAVFGIGWFGSWSHAKFAQFYNDYQQFQIMKVQAQQGAAAFQYVQQQIVSGQLPPPQAPQRPAESPER